MDSNMTGLLPYTSEAAPISGDDTNCSREKREPSMPTNRKYNFVKGKGKGRCLESRLHDNACSTDFTFPLARWAPIQPATIDPTLDLCTTYPLQPGEPRQCGIRSLPDTSTHSQHWESNPRVPRPSDLESNALSTGPHAPTLFGLFVCSLLQSPLTTRSIKSEGLHFRHESKHSPCRVPHYTSSAWRQKGLTGYCFKYIDRPFCLRTGGMTLSAICKSCHISALEIGIQTACMPNPGLEPRPPVQEVWLLNQYTNNTLADLGLGKMKVTIVNLGLKFRHHILH